MREHETGSDPQASEVKMPFAQNIMIYKEAAAWNGKIPAAAFGCFI
jgi:hypothetical protein